MYSSLSLSFDFYLVNISLVHSSHETSDLCSVLCSLICNMVCFSVSHSSDVIASYTTGCSSLLSVQYSQSNTLVCVGVT
jgi:hypothetical protein